MSSIVISDFVMFVSIVVYLVAFRCYEKLWVERTTVVTIVQSALHLILGSILAMHMLNANDVIDTVLGCILITVLALSIVMEWILLKASNQLKNLKNTP